MKNLTNNSILYAITKLADEEQQLLLDNFTTKTLREFFSGDEESVNKYIDGVCGTAMLYAKLYKALLHVDEKLKAEEAARNAKSKH